MTPEFQDGYIERVQGVSRPRGKYMNNNRILSQRRNLIVWLCLLMLVTAMPSFGQSDEDDIDTTAVRDPEPVKRSFGGHLIRTPVYLVQAPVWLIGNGTQFMIDDVYGGVFGPVLAKVISTEYRLWGAHPIVGYNSDAGFKFGAAFNSKGVLSEGERFKTRAYYSTNEYQAYRIYYNAPNLLAAHRGITFRLEYNRRMRESFYGIGPTSLVSDEVNYSEEEFLFRGGGLWVLSRSWTIGLTGGYHSINTGDGEDPDAVGSLDSIRTLLGLSPEDTRSTRFVTTTATLTNDDRNSLGRTTGGGLREFTVGYRHGVGRSEGSRYWLAQVDLRQYVEMFYQRVIALRLFGQEVEVADGDPDVPFYLKSGLGGFKTLRAYRNRRFVDNDCVLAQVEYRWPVLDLLDAFIFLDEGKVFANLNDEFTFRNWTYSTGGGMRVVGSEDVTATALIATGKEGPHYYLEFSETF